LWLPATDLEALATQRDFDVMAFQNALADAVTGPAPLPCAEGHAGSLTEYRTLELDWCPTCRGVWFDVGELRRLLDLHPDVFQDDDPSMLSAIFDTLGGLFDFPLP
jgi:hypothetical protein